LPEGSIIQARFNYRNMQPDTTWTQVWYHEGIEIIQNPDLMAFVRQAVG
jgi:hypothetical protein